MHRHFSSALTSPQITHQGTKLKNAIVQVFCLCFFIRSLQVYSARKTLARFFSKKLEETRALTGIKKEEKPLVFFIYLFFFLFNPLFTSLFHSPSKRVGCTSFESPQRWGKFLSLALSHAAKRIMTVRAFS